MNILGITASSKFGDAGDFESIATYSVGSGGEATITFSSIPATFAHLQIRAILKQSIGSGAFARFNSDTGSNYARHRLIGSGSGASAVADPSQNKVLINTSQGFSDFGAIVMDILDYANTNKYKTERHLFGIDLNGSGQVGLESNLWQSTSAITAIEFISPNGGNYAQYSHFALYGIRSA
jgi:hypothetical protein